MSSEQDGIVAEARALAEIHRAANANRVVFTSHAMIRMSQRGATPLDVIKALRTATATRWQEDHQTWLATGGTDIDGDDLDAACVIDDGVLVVTVK